MSRPIVLSNGELHVGLNNFGLVHDFYYPHVGSENHAAAQSLRHKIGVWVDGQFSWLDDGSWQFKFDYLPASLIGTVRAVQPDLQVQIETLDTVDHEHAAFIRQIHVINLADKQRDIRLFMHQVFVIGNSCASDTAQYLPDNQALVHYKGPRSFVVSGRVAGKVFDQFAIGLNGTEDHLGVYVDAEDGELSQNPVEHGRVDSVLRFRNITPAHDSFQTEYWIAAGKSQREALRIHDKLSHEGALHRILVTDASWKQWFEPAQKVASLLLPEFRESFIKSIGIMKSHIDRRGAIIASSDTSMLNHSRDSYAYCWPRDGAYVIWPLLRLGYTHEIINFFSFCRRVMNPKGYLMHKYQADGALGSSWHPYTKTAEGQILPPIQEDETAIIVFLFAQYYRMHSDDKLLRDFYPTMIAPMADFMASYVDPATCLPLPSYDLWERVLETTTYTTAVVYGALLGAAELADAVDSPADAVRWRQAADNMKSHAGQLYDSSGGYLIKGLRRTETGYQPDMAVDISSAYGAALFGLYAADSSQITSSYQMVLSRLRTSQQHIGLARFENDEYYRGDPGVVGNPWYLTSLWSAQPAIERDDISGALAVIGWVRDQMLPSGALAEQFDSSSGRFLSVAPLAWSQAEYVNSLLDTLPKHFKQAP